MARVLRVRADETTAGERPENRRAQRCRAQDRSDAGRVRGQMAGCLVQTDAVTWVSSGEFGCDRSRGGGFVTCCEGVPHLECLEPKA